MPFPLVVILGPTGSGKSHLGIELALSFDGEIVNCDSLQLYKGFNIGTAKPSTAERRGVPHHLIDVLRPEQVSTAGDYADRARPVLAEITARQHLPFLVGGSGFYVRALLDGLAPGPPRDEALRTRLALRESRRAGFLHRLLRRLDPPTAARVHPNDHNKLIRAIEISWISRRPATQVFAAGRNSLSGFDPLKIVLDPPRPALRERLAERTRRMFDSGLVGEVSTLLESGTPPTVKPFESLGYKEALAFLDGRITLGQAIELTTIETRQYAKRQWTWFRRESNATWIQAFGGEESTLAQAREMISRYLHKFSLFPHQKQ